MIRPALAGSVEDVCGVAKSDIWRRSAPDCDGWMRVYDRVMLGDG